MTRTAVGVVVTLLVTAALAPAAVGGAAAQSEEQVTVTIVIVDSNNEGVGDVQATVSWQGGSENITTPPNGVRNVGVPKGADLEITINDDKYVRNAPFEISNVGDQRVEVDVALSDKGVIRVKDSNGRSVSNARVSVLEGSVPVQILRTNQDGTVTTRRLERGQYNLEVGKSGFFVNDTQSLSLDGTGDSQTVTINRGQKPVTFDVVDDNFDQPRPIDNATVRIRGNSLNTFNGQATTSLPVNQDYRVEVSKPGYRNASREFDLNEQSKTVDVTMQRTPDLKLSVANDRVVVGESTFITVTNEYNNPVSGATITAGGKEIGQTNTNGQATVPVTTEGNITISVSDRRGLSESVTVEGVDDVNPTPEPTTAQPTTAKPTAEPTTAEPTEGGNGSSDGGSGPGFGIVGALAALGAALLLARQR